MRSLKTTPSARLRMLRDLFLIARPPLLEKEGNVAATTPELVSVCETYLPNETAIFLMMSAIARSPFLTRTTCRPSVYRA